MRNSAVGPLVDATSFVGLRVAIVGPVPPPNGGMAAQTRQLADLLRSEGADATIVAVNAPYRPSWIRTIPVLRAWFRLGPYLADLWRVAGEVDLFHVMANSGWAWHLFAAPAVWVARIRGVPVIVNYRGGEAGSFLDRSATSVRCTMRVASSLIVPSGFLVGVFQRHGLEARIVPNVVDLAQFRMSNVQEPIAREPHIVVTRNLEQIYDVATAVRAFAEVRRVMHAARLSIAGSGPERMQLERLVADLQLGDAVQFVGRLDRPAMVRLLQTAHLMLNASREDNMPNSALEALASGVPIVSTDVGGIPYLLEQGRTAILVQAGDYQAMAKAALEVLRVDGVRERLVSEGLSEVRRYTWDAVRPLLADVYHSALRTAGTGMRKEA